MNKPKTTEEWLAWCQRWDTADHEGKQRLSAEHGITYETARHWRSDCKVSKQEPKPTMRIDIGELLGQRPAVNLDFCSFDIETSNLDADFSILLSTVIKPFGQEPIVFRGDDYTEWDENRANDFQIVKDVTDELRRHAIIIGHYGDRFDIPYIRAKLVKHGLPPLPQMFGIDSWKIARDNFKVSSRRLKNLAEYFDIGEKEPVEGNLWVAAAYSGSREAMDKIVEHNIVDCEVLEKLAAISFPLLKSIRRI